MPDIQRPSTGIQYRRTGARLQLLQRRTGARLQSVRRLVSMRNTRCDAVIKTPYWSQNENIFRINRVSPSTITLNTVRYWKRLRQDVSFMSSICIFKNDRKFLVLIKCASTQSITKNSTQCRDIQDLKS